MNNLSTALLMESSKQRTRRAIKCLAVYLATVSAPVLAFDTQIPLDSLDGANGFTIDGITIGDTAGGAVRGAGDVNGDGLVDLIIGARYVDGETGESYVVFGTGQGFPVRLSLASLDGGNGFAIRGSDPGDNSGFEVSGAGDINGDGIGDLTVGAPFADRPSLMDVGESYVVFGSAQGFPAVVDVSTLDGTDGFTLIGVDDDGNAGLRVSDAGDVNADGIDDLVIGAMHASPEGRVEAGVGYVVFGSDQGFPAVVELSTLDGTDGFAIHGVNPKDFSGRASGAGDVNADGIDDLIVGALGAEPQGQTMAGEAYIVFGSDLPRNPSFRLSLLDGTNGFTLEGEQAGDGAGVSVNGAGDVNGDGIDDFLIGAQGADPSGRAEAGKTYVIFGTGQGFPARLALSNVAGNFGFVVPGIDAGDSSGAYVSGAGDVNGDGLDDLIIGAAGADPGGTLDAGEAYLLFGTDRGFPAEIDPRDLDGGNGFVLQGITAGDYAGVAVSGMGDINDDGTDDVIVGSGLNPLTRLANPARDDAGESYVVFGERRPELGGDTMGLIPFFLSCTNWTGGQTVLGFPFPSTAWSCTQSPLTARAGDAVSVLVRSLRSGDTLESSPGGSVIGMDPIFATCGNLRTGQVTIIPGSSSWDCAARGFEAEPFDVIDIFVLGVAH